MKVEALTCALGAEVKEIALAEGCGHWIREQRPDFVAAQVLRHVAGT